MEPYQKCECYICGNEYWYGNMVEKNGNPHCEMCASLPPYSDALYWGIVGFQKLFRAFFSKNAKICASCHEPHLGLKDFRKDIGPICERCVQEEIDHIRQELECPGCGYEQCHCYEDEGICEECGNPHECVCLELKEDARLARHRRTCGLPDCDGDCGTLACGCIDKCKGCWMDDDY